MGGYTGKACEVTAAFRKLRGVKPTLALMEYTRKHLDAGLTPQLGVTKWFDGLTPELAREVKVLALVPIAQGIATSAVRDPDAPIIRAGKPSSPSHPPRSQEAIDAQRARAAKNFLETNKRRDALVIVGRRAVDILKTRHLSTGISLSDARRSDLLREAHRLEQHANASTLDATLYRELAGMIGDGTVGEYDRAQTIPLIEQRWGEAA